MAPKSRQLIYKEVVVVILQLAIVIQYLSHDNKATIFSNLDPILLNRKKGQIGLKILFFICNHNNTLP